MPVPDHNRLQFDLSETDQSIGQRFAAQVAAYPTRIAIETPYEQISYSQLDRWTSAIAASLIESGAASQDCVVIIAEQGSELIAATLSVLKAGCIYVPVDPRWSHKQAASVIVQAQPSILLCDENNTSLGQLLAIEGSANVVSINSPTNIPTNKSLEVSDYHLPHVQPTDCAYVYFTSGSTGEPKGVIDSHRNVLHNIRRYTTNLNITERDRITLLQSCGFSGAVSNVFCALLNGATLLPIDIVSLGVRITGQWLTSLAPTIYHSVPSIWRSIVNMGFHLPSLRIIRLEGDAASPIDVELYRKHFNPNCSFVHGLGATEMGIVAQHFVDHKSPYTDFVPVGLSTAEVELGVFDQHNQPLPANEIGEVVVTSDFLAMGYWRQPVATAVAFFSNAEGRHYRTGDLGLLHSDGTLELHGRVDHQIEIQGEWVDVMSIEASLRQQAGVSDVVVCASSSQVISTPLTAFVVADGLVDGAALQTKLTDSTLPHKSLYSSVFVQSLPLDKNGKVDRAGLQAIPISSAAEAMSLNQPRNPTEQSIANLFQRLLGLQHVDIHASFFDLGGDSLLAVDGVTALEEMFVDKFAFAAFQSSVTVAQIAEDLTNQPAGNVLTRLQEAGDEQPFYCVHAHMGHTFNLRLLANRFAPDHPFYAFQACDLNQQDLTDSNIVSLAQTYVTALKSVQPVGPYALGGYCYGSWVAVEMARQIQQLGDDVEFLALIDPDLPRPTSIFQVERCVHLLITTLNGAGHNWVQWIRQWFEPHRNRQQNRADSKQPVSATLTTTQIVLDAAMDSYVARPYNKPTCLVLSENKHGPWARRIWRRWLTGNVRVVPVGDARDLLREPAARQLGDALLLHRSRARS